MLLWACVRERADEKEMHCEVCLMNMAYHANWRLHCHTSRPPPATMLPSHGVAATDELERSSTEPRSSCSFLGLRHWDSFSHTQPAYLTTIATSIRFGCIPLLVVNSRIGSEDWMIKQARASNTKVETTQRTTATTTMTEMTFPPLRQSFPTAGQGLSFTSSRPSYRQQLVTVDRPLGHVAFAHNADSQKLSEADLD